MKEAKESQEESQESWRKWKKLKKALAKMGKVYYNDKVGWKISRDAGLAQSVERRIRNA